jgi:NADH-quinone oxidoreductase subunit N
MTGSLDYARISEVLLQGQTNHVTLFIAFILILAGFGYKVVFVPFHMWSPDVYQGAPTPFTAFLSVGSNAAGVAIMIRFFFPAASRLGKAELISATGVEWPNALLFVSMLTMTVGNLCAPNQQNVKRLAYSGIAHAATFGTRGFE